MLAQNAAKVAREQLTLIQIFEEVRERGYDGGYDTVALRGRWTEIDNGFIPTATRTAGICGGTTVSWGEVELLEPGGVPTKTGGSGAPDDIDKAHRTQVWLATSDEPTAAVSGRYFFHLKLRNPDPATKDVHSQCSLDTSSNCMLHSRDKRGD